MFPQAPQGGAHAFAGTNPQKLGEPYKRASGELSPSGSYEF